MRCSVICARFDVHKPSVIVLQAGMKKCLSACLCSLHCSNWKTLICFRNWFVIKKQGSNSRTVSLWPCFLRNLSSTSMNAEHSGVSGRFRARSVSSFQAQEPFQVYLLIQIKPIAGFFLGSHFLVTERILRRIHGDNRGMQSRVKTGHGFADQLTPLDRPAAPTDSSCSRR